jgi:hypothetical protein
MGNLETTLAKPTGPALFPFAFNPALERMKRPGLAPVIAAPAGVTLIYMASLVLEASPPWIFGFCLASMAALVWMAIRILKDPYTTPKTFDEYFYQDRDDLRRNGKE